MWGSLKFTFALSNSIIYFLIAIKLKLIEASIIRSTFWNPINDFIKTHGKLAISTLIIIGFYRVADIVMVVMANLFYSDIGYSLKQIATFSKFWGLFATILGDLLEGVLAIKYNVFFVLLIGGILSSSSNLLFAILSNFEPNPMLLLSVIIADNLSGGIASVTFVAFLSSLTNKQFTATQFAFFTSIMLFIPKIIEVYSRRIVDSIGYESFFIFTAALGIPVVILIFLLKDFMLTIK